MYAHLNQPPTVATHHTRNPSVHHVHTHRCTPFDEAPRAAASIRCPSTPLPLASPCRVPTARYTSLTSRPGARRAATEDARGADSATVTARDREAEAAAAATMMEDGEEEEGKGKKDTRRTALARTRAERHGGEGLETAPTRELAAVEAAAPPAASRVGFDPWLECCPIGSRRGCRTTWTANGRSRAFA